MKIQFDPNLDYQQEAIKSVTDTIFLQDIPNCERSAFTIELESRRGLWQKLKF